MRDEIRKLPHGMGAALLILLIGAACAPPPPPGEGEVSAADAEASFKAFAQAWEQENVDAATAAFAPDAVVFDPVPPGRFEGAAGIRSWISGSFEALDHISIRSSQFRVQTRGPVAWGTTHFLFEAERGGQPVRFEGDLTLVWVRQVDGSLRLSVFHASHLPTTPGA